MENLSITEVAFNENYKIHLYLSNQNTIIFDMKSKIRTTRFVELKDPDLFQKGVLIGGKIIRWSPYMEISLDEILFYVTGRNIINERFRWKA